MKMATVLPVAVVVVCMLLNPSLGQTEGDDDPSLNDLMKKFFATWNLTDDFPRVGFTDKELVWFYSLGASRTQTELDGLPEYDGGQTEEEGERARSKRQTDDPSISTRKEYRHLTSAERLRFKVALNNMKTTIVDPMSGRSEYDIFVLYHRNTMSPAAHGGFAFLPWHREFLWRFERALKTHVFNTFLPYWDTQLDQSLPEPRDSVLWTSYLWGNNVGAVTNGFAANWDAIPECSTFGSTLTRNARTNPTASSLLFTQTKVNNVLSQTTYSGVGCTGCSFENDHGGPHVFVDGHMGQLQCSPSDPVFWMHHAYIDCLWESFRQGPQTTVPTSDYPTTGSVSHRPFSPMSPFDFFYNIHGMSNHYTDYYYTCAPRPTATTCSVNIDCGSYAFLFCHNNVCKSKIRPGGDCTGLPDVACYGSSYICQSNVCTFTLIAATGIAAAPLDFTH